MTCEILVVQITFYRQDFSELDNYIPCTLNTLKSTALVDG